jgi:hypothetical protein
MSYLPFSLFGSSRSRSGRRKTLVFRNTNKKGNPTIPDYWDNAANVSLFFGRMYSPPKTTKVSVNGQWKTFVFLGDGKCNSNGGTQHSSKYRGSKNVLEGREREEKTRW